ncbi:hypothetical protein FQN50_008172 [Emmonsiellopsis sp. PD_5]|nr:hypothetical protein FQN50_008172 [Emmonsiellopsis sp. PD_5]
MQVPPVNVIASWPRPNFEDPEYQGPQLAIVGIVFTTISIFVVILRIWVRMVMKRNAGWDDWLIVLATVAWALQLLLAIVMMLVKLSILISYTRFATSTFRYAVWVTMAIVLAWGIAFIIVLLLACRPLQAYWNWTLAGTCSDEPKRTLAFTTTNIITDGMVLLLPIPTFWKLRLPLRERIVLIILMSLGLIACAASIVRTYYAKLVFEISYDSTWDGYNIWLWVLVELNLAALSGPSPSHDVLDFPRLPKDFELFPRIQAGLSLVNGGASLKPSKIGTDEKVCEKSVKASIFHQLVLMGKLQGGQIVMDLLSNPGSQDIGGTDEPSMDATIGTSSELNFSDVSCSSTLLKAGWGHSKVKALGQCRDPSPMASPTSRRPQQWMDRVFFLAGTPAINLIPGSQPRFQVCPVRGCPLGEGLCLTQRSWWRRYSNMAAEISSSPT